MAARLFSGFATVAGEMGGSEALQQRAMRRVEVAQRDEVVGQSPVLIPGPGVEGSHQRRLVDQVRSGGPASPGEDDAPRRFLGSWRIHSQKIGDGLGKKDHENGAAG